MLTARGEETDRIVGLELGADDYIVKPFSAREVAARIRAVLQTKRGGARDTSSEGPLTIGPVRLDPDRRSAELNGEPLDLTRKEWELLRMLMSEAGAVINRERLIDEVWDTNWYGSTKTLDVHVSSLRKKLGDDSPAAAPDPHGARRRLPLLRSRRAMSLRVRLVVAFAYVLLLVVVALEVPLALNLSKRVDAEIRSEAESQAQLVAAGASGRLEDERQLKELVDSSAESLSGRVIVVDQDGDPLADSAAARRPRRLLRLAARDPERPRRHARPRASATATPSTPTSSTPPSP